MNQIIRSSCKKEIFINILLSIFLISFYIVSKYYMKSLNTIINNNIGIISIIICLYFFIMLLKCFVKKYFNYIEIKDGIVIKKQLFLKNNTIIPISFQTIINTKQSILQMVLKLMDLEIEADGDPTVPEISIKDIPDKYYDLISNLKVNK